MAAGLADEHDQAIRRDDLGGHRERLVAAHEIEDDVCRPTEGRGRRGSIRIEEAHVRTKFRRALQPRRRSLRDDDEELAATGGEEAEVLEGELAEASGTDDEHPRARTPATAAHRWTAR